MNTLARAHSIVATSRLTVPSARSVRSPTVTSFSLSAAITSGASNPQRNVSGFGVLDWARQAKMGCELAPKEAPEGLQLGTFAGGCFWGLELAMQRVPGVVVTSSGYTQGNTPDPTYESVCSGSTGHTEAVQVAYDPKETNFTKLLEAFAAQTDVTQKNRQGSDRGTQYRSGVYYHTEQQKVDTEAYFAQLNEEIAAGKRNWTGKSVVAEVKPAGDYFIAEKYHQQYLSKGGRFGMPQSAEKGASDTIRCYG